MWVHLNHVHSTVQHAASPACIVLLCMAWLCVPLHLVLCGAWHAVLHAAAAAAAVAGLYCKRYAACCTLCVLFCDTSCLCCFVSTAVCVRACVCMDCWVLLGIPGSSSSCASVTVCPPACTLRTCALCREQCEVSGWPGLRCLAPPPLPHCWHDCATCVLHGGMSVYVSCQPRRRLVHAPSPGVVTLRGSELAWVCLAARACVKVCAMVALLLLLLLCCCLPTCLFSPTR